MDILSMVVAIVVLGILYKRMIDREVPEKIGTLQALVPVGLGVASLVLSFFLMIGSGLLLTFCGYVRDAHPVWVQSLVAAFIVAGLPEEIAKFLMIAITILLFRKSIRNVYEYVLIGAGVGAGFTVFEEFLYGSGLAVIIFRLFLIALHMIFGMIMGYYLGKARFQKMSGKGSVFVNYVLAFIIPMALHTAHDACTGMNMYLQSDNDALEDIGIIIGIVGTIIFFVLQFTILKQFWKNAEKYSMMTLIRQENAAGYADQNA